LPTSGDVARDPDDVPSTEVGEFARAHAIALIDARHDHRGAR